MLFYNFYCIDTDSSSGLELHVAGLELHVARLELHVDERKLHDAERKLHDAERKLHVDELELHDAERKLHGAVSPSVLLGLDQQIQKKYVERGEKDGSWWVFVTL